MKTAEKELEILGWMRKEGYDRKASQQIAPIIVKYLSSHSQEGEENKVDDFLLEKPFYSIYDPRSKTGKYETEDDYKKDVEKWTNLLRLIERNTIEFAEYIKYNAKYCEGDGWKDENGLGATMTNKELYEKFLSSTKEEGRRE